MNIIIGTVLLLAIMGIFLAIYTAYQKLHGGEETLFGCASCASHDYCESYKAGARECDSPVDAKEKKYEAVFFDLDGTLLDTLADLKNAVNVSLEAAGMPKRSMDEVRQFVGNGIHLLIERAVPEGTAPEKTEEVFAAFKSYYTEHCLEETKAYVGVQAMLTAVHGKGYPMAVITNKNEEAAKSLIQTVFKGKIGLTVGQHDGVAKKPAPDMFLLTAKKLHVNAKNVLYVGDSDVDLMFANSVGCDCVTVSWGFRGREFLKEAGAKTIIDKPSELVDIL